MGERVTITARDLTRAGGQMEATTDPDGNITLGCDEGTVLAWTYIRLGNMERRVRDLERALAAVLPWVSNMPGRLNREKVEKMKDRAYETLGSPHV